MAMRSPCWVLVLAAAAGSLGAGGPAPTGAKTEAVREGGELRARYRELEARVARRAPSVSEARALRRDAAPRAIRPDARADTTSSRRELVVEMYPRFEELSRRGSAAATLWCLEYLDAVAAQPSGAGESDEAERVALYRRLLDQAPEEPAAARAALSQLGLDAHRLGVEVATEVARGLGLRTAEDEVRAAALLAEARILVAAAPDARDRARALFDEVGARYPATAAAREARDGRWRLDHLTVGERAPDFTTYDAFGNELRLSDFRGQVTVVRFWSADDVDCSAERAHDRRLASRLWDERFVLLGINADSDRGAFLRRCDELEVSWPTAWEGGASRSTAHAWRVDRRPATYVLDADGVVRFVDVSGPGLDRAVDLLLAETREGAAGVRPPTPARTAQRTSLSREERSLQRRR